MVETNIDIISKNKTIAIFDGWVPKDTNETKNEDKFVRRNLKKSGYITIKSDRLLYHVNWSWLMPVFIEVIQQVKTLGIYVRIEDCKIETNNKKYTHESLMTNVYDFCYDQIILLNESKN